jgi:uncharacterized membrane protein YecN with MAPEG domain
MRRLPESRLGKRAAGMTLLYVLLIVVFFLFMAAGLVDFDTGHWWDVTVGVAVPIALTAFILSILAVRKEQTVITWCSLVLGGLVILFLLTHSLFIHD